MRSKSRIMKVTGVMCLLVLSASVVLIPLEKGATVGVVSPVGEDTFEFTNDETEDAYDLHIEWSRAVEVKEVKPFKKKEGSGTSRTDLSNGVVKPTEKASVTVAWDGSDPKVKQWWWTKKGGTQLGEKKTGNPTTASTSITPRDAAAKASVVTANGLHRASFGTIQGRVIVNLPDDMMAGDTISGTVVVEPKGNTDDERQANASRLSELKLSFGSKFPQEKKELTVLITPRIINRDEENSTPPGPNQTNFTTKVPDSFDYTLGVNAPRTDAQTVTITINEPIWFINNQPTTPPGTPSPNDFHFPDIIQQGRNGQISGPGGMKVFDGNAANTRLMYGPAGSTVQDFEKNTENVSGGFGLIRPVAESPRQCVFQAPTTIAGPVQFYLKEGALETVAPANSVGLNLSGKTNLLKNEHTNLKVDVFGLQGIRKPVPLTLEARGVIRLDAGNYQQFMIQPSQVGADGRYSTTFGGTGVEVGGWSATATVVTQPFNIVLRDPDPPGTLLINSFTGEYVFCGPPPKLTGTGQIKRQGCIIELTDNKPDRVVQGTFNVCLPVDNARLFTFYSAGANTDLKVTVTDTQPPRRKIYFNPLNRPMPPVQDTSAFATCP